ncbi:MAG: ABC transporter permease [Anaerolineales bacterium]|nr:ABC transporter permease [Anaerolineales bacterium]
MNRIFDITLKDLLQLVRDFKTFMFLLIMPIIFTFLFGFAFGGIDGSADSRLPIGFLDQDGSWVSQALRDQLEKSDIVRIGAARIDSAQELVQLVADGDLAAVIIVPDRYGSHVLKGRTVRLIVFAETDSTAWTTVEAEILTAADRVDSAVRVATILEAIDAKRMPFDYSFDQVITAWEDPPIAVKETLSPVIKDIDQKTLSLAHTSPGMMLQFAIASLLTIATIIVNERKTRSLQRMLTTATRRIDILLGHFLTIFIMLFAQFTFLILFAQLVLRIDYLRVPFGTLLVMVSSILCISALGLLIGVLAKSDDQAVIFSLIPMFVFSGIGGAWVPLEFTGKTFSAIGHLSPIAWAMDGFKNITMRGLGIESVLLPSLALVGYAAVFFSIAAWRFQRVSE